MSQEDVIFGVTDQEIESEQIETKPPLRLVETSETQLLIDARMAVISKFYGVETDAMLFPDNFTMRLTRARRVATHVLRETVGLNFIDVATVLNRSLQSTRKTYKKLGEEMSYNKPLVKEVAYLGTVKKVRQSIDERIITRVSEVTGIKQPNIWVPTSSEDRQARSMAIALMAERGYVSPKEIAEDFGIARSQEIYRINKVFGYREPLDPLLAEQMKWVRQKILTERLAKFSYKEPLEKKKPLEDNDDLPKINEKIVHPNVVKAVYGVIRSTADFYGLPATELIGRSNDFTHARARRAALLICADMRVPTEELGICFGARDPDLVENYTSRAREKVTRDRFFSQEIEDIVSGEPRRDITEETLTRVCLYYGLKPKDLRDDRGPGISWQGRARSVYFAAMARHQTIPREIFAPVVGRDGSTARNVITNTEQRAVKQPRLKVEIEYIVDPFNNPRPPTPNELLDHFLKQAGISFEELKNPDTPKNRQTRRIAAFILAEEACMPQFDIAEFLDDLPGNVKHYIKRTRAEMEQDPKLALEIDALLPDNAINRPVVGKILRLVSERFGYDLSQLKEASTDDPRHQQALETTIKLMLKGTKYSADSVAELFSLPTEAFARLVR
jgi:hypothetical protein